MSGTSRWVVVIVVVATAVMIASRIAAKAPTPPSQAPVHVAETDAPAPPPRRPAAPTMSEEPAADPGFVVHIVDRESRKPIVGATVELWADGHARTATTDADGAAHLYGPVPFDADRLRIRAPGRQTEDFRASSKILSGEEPLAIAFHPGATVEGVVLESNGRRIAGAHVEAMAFHAGGIEEFPQRDIPPRWEATSATDGAFRLEGLPANFKWALFFSAPLHVRTDVVWTQDSLKRVEVRLPPAGRVRGVVRDPTGGVAAKAFVFAVPSDSKEEVREPFQAEFLAKTDAEGRYELDGLPLDQGWTVTASALEGFADSQAVPCATLSTSAPDAVCDLALRTMARIEVRVLDPSGNAATNAKVRCAHGDETESDDVDDAGRCEFEFKRSGAWRITVDAPGVGSGGTDAECAVGQTTSVTIRLDAGVSIAGVVVDDRDVPIAGATVDAAAVAGDVRRKGTADAAGAFRIVGVAVGTYSFSAQAPDHEQLESKGVTAPSDDMRIVLRRNGRVSLRLRTPKEGPTPGGWRLSWRSVGEPFRFDSSQVDWSDGESTVAVPPGKWNVEVEPYDYVVVHRFVDIAPGATTALGEIVLDPGVTLTGRVVDAKGRGIPEARVECCRRCEDTDEDGAFKIQHVAVGMQSVDVDSAEFLPAEIVHAVAADGPPLVVTLARGALLSGFVHDAAGKPVGDVDVIVSRDGAVEARLEGDARGKFETRLAAGRRRVVVQRRGETIATNDVELVDGDDATLDIVVGR